MKCSGCRAIAVQGAHDDARIRGVIASFTLSDQITPKAARSIMKLLRSYNGTERTDYIPSLNPSSLAILYSIE